MLAESLITRGVHFAFLFGPPRTVERQEAARAYDNVCDALRIQDFTFRYESPDTSPRSRGFKIDLGRKEGKGAFGVTVDNPNIQQPIRLLLQYAWPPSLQHVTERFDLAADAVFEALEGEWQRVRAEVRLRAHCSVRSRNARALLRKDYLALPDTWVSALGEPLTFVGLKFRTAAGAPEEGPLDAPSRDLAIEVLQEDPACLYFEFVSMWPQAPNVAGASGAVAVQSLRTFNNRPSEYVDSAHEFLSERLRGLSEVGRIE
jgi:hypothetical protein